MELAIYFPNLERLLDMENALRIVDIQDVPSYLVSVMYAQGPNVYDYSVNLGSTTWIQLLHERGIDFSRLYFGQEFCQNLIPSPSDVEQAYYFSRQLGWEFTYMTGGYNTEVGIEKIEANLRKLVELEADCEVVVNDWGVLHILTQRYPQFRLVVGRLLNKQVRLNMFMGGRDLPVFTGGLETSKDEIMANQIAAYADVSVSNPDYLEALKSWGVQGVDFDITPQGIRRPEDGWGLTLGFYYPWTLMATGRNCPTAGIYDKVRTFVMTDRDCGRPCRKFNCSPNMLQFDYPVCQRGPALFVQHDDFNERYITSGTSAFERLIYQPEIPL